MPLLDVYVARPCLQSCANVMNVRILMQGGAISNFPFTRGRGTWRSFGIPVWLEMKFVDVRKSELIIKAVATLENRSAVRGERRRDNIGVEDQLQFSSEDSEDLEEREKLRRMRISKANKGNTPWNKGRKHSAETMRRIKERTSLAMQDPKVKMKLVNQGHAQNEETKIKIAVGVRIGWERRRQRMLVQEMCHFEWQNLIAEASRRGFSSEEELHWDSYKQLDEQLGNIWDESVELRKKTPRVVGSRRAPESIEQGRKIAEAISAKWSDPNYRNRVCSALAKFHCTPEGIERKPRRIPRDPAQTRSRSAARKTSKDVPSLSEGEINISYARAKLRRSNVPKYKDPMASSKLEMIKRAAADIKKTAAVERARLMIAEAHKEARALEATASTNPHSMASLIETRKLINEAIQSIQSIDATLVTSLDNSPQLSEYSDEPWDNVASEKDTVNIKTTNVIGAKIKINGTHVQSLIGHEVLHSPNRTQYASLDDEEEVLLPKSSNGYVSAPRNSTPAAHFHFNKGPRQPVSSQTIKCHNTVSPNGAPSNFTMNKNWVRGRTSMKRYYQSMLQNDKPYVQYENVGEASVQDHQQIREEVVKTCLRNRIGDEWLNDLLVAYIERDILLSVKNEDVLETFQKMKSRRGVL